QRDMTAAAARTGESRGSLWLLLAALLCAIAAGAVLTSAGLPDASLYAGQEADGLRYAASPGERAPLFEAVTASGDDFSLLALRGRPVVLNFWATWCAPCAVEMPELQRVHDTFGDSAAIVGVNTGESAEMVRAWAAERVISFPLALDEAGETAALYQLRGQPTTVILDAYGVVRDIVYGPTTFDSLSRSLEALISNPS
ncbi:MAG: TlpA family protein disulfide reductase, partial [Anaerolineae bacterium]|nr:TlpA family protein disulfide reductase [Anaerolineae bacterium]